MRFVLAISSLVLSGILLILGIGQVTFLAGPHEVNYSAKLDAPNNLAVISAEQLSMVPGQANVVVDGDSAIVAVGQSRDVDAWVAPFAHAQLTVDREAEALVFSPVSQDQEAADAYATLIGAEEGEEIVVPSPAGSDLWLEQRGTVLSTDSGEGEAPAADAATETETTGTAQPEESALRLPVSLSEDQAVLVSVDQQNNSSEVSISWIQDRRTPWAGPLLVAGGLFAIIGAVLYLLAVDHDRRGLGPQRGRRGPLLGIRNLFGKGARGQAGKNLQRTTVVSALGLTAALALSGCSPSYWPSASPSEEETVSTQEAESSSNVAPVPVTQTQINRIIGDIAALAGEADDTLDAAGLEARFTGDALTQREANYTIRKAVSDYEVVVPRITDQTLGYQLVQSTEGWPRTVFVVVASESDATAAAPEEGDTAATEEADSPSLALIMTQAGPHENFLVSKSIALRGGITMPEAAPASEGTALLADDLQSLVMTPAEVGAAYAAVLAGGVEVEEAANFDLEGDSLVERSGAAWVAQSTQAASSAGQGIQYSVSAAQSDSKIVSLSTGVGGALVATTVLETRVEQPEEGGRWRPTVPKSLTALSGLEGQQEKLVSVVAHQLLFFVPSSTSDSPIQLLGYTSDLVSAGNS